MDKGILSSCQQHLPSYIGIWLLSELTDLSEVALELLLEGVEGLGVHQQKQCRRLPKKLRKWLYCRFHHLQKTDLARLSWGENLSRRRQSRHRQNRKDEVGQIQEKQEGCNGKGHAKQVAKKRGEVT